MTATFLAAQDPWSARVDAVSPGVDGNRVSTIPWSWPLGTRHVGTRLAGQPTHAPHVHPSLQGVWSPDCGVRADRGRGRGDCRRTRRGVLRTPPHPTAPGSLVDLRGRSGGLTGHAHERTKATTPSSTSGSRSARATCSGGRQTGRERLHIRGSQLAPSDVKLQGAVSFTNDLHFHSNLRPAVPGHLDDAGAVEGPASREPSVSGVRRGPSASRVRTTSPCAQLVGVDHRRAIPRVHPASHRSEPLPRPSQKRHRRRFKDLRFR